MTYIFIIYVQHVYRVYNVNHLSFIEVLVVLARHTVLGRMEGREGGYVISCKNDSSSGSFFITSMQHWIRNLA